jgi:hypothetical protein
MLSIKYDGVPSMTAQHVSLPWLVIMPMYQSLLAANYGSDE